MRNPWARGTKRDLRVSWFWWLGGAPPSLAEIPQLYGRRFGQEHSYRFLKQDLLWAVPRVRTPEQQGNRILKSQHPRKVRLTERGAKALGFDAGHPTPAQHSDAVALYLIFT